LFIAADGSHEPSSRLELLEQGARNVRGRRGGQDDRVVGGPLAPPLVAVTNPYPNVPIAQLVQQPLGLLTEGRDYFDRVEIVWPSPIGSGPSV
jgi:hypothetical protein